MKATILESTKTTLFNYGGTLYKHVYHSNNMSGLAIIFMGDTIIYDPYDKHTTAHGREVEQAFRQALNSKSTN